MNDAMAGGVSWNRRGRTDNINLLIAKERFPTPSTAERSSTLLEPTHAPRKKKTTAPRKLENRMAHLSVSPHLSTSTLCSAVRSLMTSASPPPPPRADSASHRTAALTSLTRPRRGDIVTGVTGADLTDADRTAGEGSWAIRSRRANRTSDIGPPSWS